jgi:hypothetical protein
MKHANPLLCILAALFLLAACKSENAELKADAAMIASVMCRNIEAMNHLKSANPADSMQVDSLQQVYEKIESEMQQAYADFHKKYGDKVNTKEFGDEFRRYLNQAMLECKCLSPEDRANFEREVGK